MRRGRLAVVDDPQSVLEWDVFGSISGVCVDDEVPLCTSGTVNDLLMRVLFL